MAISKPWVGSSAKNETGKSSMKDAGTALKMGTPFMMSQMVGKSMSSPVDANVSIQNYWVDGNTTAGNLDNQTCGWTELGLNETYHVKWKQKCGELITPKYPFTFGTNSVLTAIYGTKTFIFSSYLYAMTIVFSTRLDASYKRIRLTDTDTGVVIIFPTANIPNGGTDGYSLVSGRHEYMVYGTTEVIKTVDTMHQKNGVIKNFRLELLTT